MKQQSTSKGFATLSSAAIAGKLLSVVYMPLLLKIIGGDRSFAIYNVTYQIYAFIYVLTNTGIPSSISKIVSEFISLGNYRSAIKTFKISRILLFIIGIVMSIIMFCISGPLTIHMNYMEARYSVVALCPAIIFTSVSSAYRGYFQGTSNMKPTAISQVMEQVLNTVFSLLFADILIKYGIVAGCIGATVGTTLGAMISGIYLIHTYRKITSLNISDCVNNIKVIKHGNKQILIRVLKYSIPITLCIGITNAGALIDSYNITNRLIAAGNQPKFAQAIYGMYAKYITLINVPISIISALAVAVLPAISSAVILKNKNMAKNKIIFAYKINFLIAIPSAVGFSVLGYPIYELLHLKDGYRIMIFGSIIVLFMGLMQIQTSILQGMGRLYVVTLYAILGIVTKYIINYILVAVPGINIYGAIIGSAVGFGIPILLNILYIQKTLKLKINVKFYILKPLISSMLMAAAIYLSYNVISLILGFVFKGYLNNAISVVMAIILGVVVYLKSLIMINGIDDDEIDILPNRLKNLIYKTNTAR